MSMINSFLSKCIRRATEQMSKVTVVMGNEGGDMDSVIGSLYLAMFFDKCEKYKVKNAIPVINFPRSDLRLRNDIYILLRKYGVDTNLFMSICKSEELQADISAESKQINTEEDKLYFDFNKHKPLVVLYDQNVLPKRFEFLKSNVIAIVDHHVDEGLYKESCAHNTALRVIETAASACTLVARLYKEHQVDVECPSLLLAPIVLDSVNFDPAQKKVTALDIAMYEWLRQQASENVLLNASPSTPLSIEANDLYKQLVAWKDDIFTLTFMENLRRDYKHFSFEQNHSDANERSIVEIGISSMPCSYANLCDKYSDKTICDSCAEFVQSHHLHGLLIALAGKRGKEHTREVVIFAAPPFLQTLLMYVQSEPGGVKFSETKSITCEADYKFICYALSDASVSRKRLTPSLAQFFKHGSSSSL